MNNATPDLAQSVFDGVDYLSSFGNDSGGYNNNPVKSFSLNNGTVVVNVTQPGHKLFPGYVARTVSNGVVNNFGEGVGWAQGPIGQKSGLSYFIDNVWYPQTEQILGDCLCK
ncbi:hypothetical protein [Diaphorobacter aerolatus]|uniref:Uncharacterized protein n=1 Tax=Diaphorobacter aerolatus TaxID=1288495 RepID=A0A7H0GGK3_9BURK|nr:hypothetical protein [Diaphorobacter aerolatus]QNP47419.1 hypothetical protein H9K75_14025 [Diaphorobacter aerolatus]